MIRRKPVRMKKMTDLEITQWFFSYSPRESNVGSYRIPTYVIESAVALDKKGKLGRLLRRELKRRKAAVQPGEKAND